MKKQIRRGVFETNSSSVHALCISTGDVLLNIPKEVYFSFGEFGWEFEEYNDLSDKASYLYTAIYGVLEEEEVKEALEFIETTLKNAGVETVEFAEKINSWYGCGYIDHVYETIDFVRDVTSSEDNLLNYLFSTASFIKTGNDNSDEEVDIDVDYLHLEYYKGN